LKRIVEILICLFLFASVSHGQVSKAESLFTKSDSVTQVVKKQPMGKKNQKQKNDTITKTEYKPDPIQAVWMGAIIPGYGQILNRSYWKLPLVYAGFLGWIYAITWNSSRYETYSLAYRDITDGNAKTNSFLDILPPGYTLETYPGGESGLTSNLSTAYEQSRRYRDLSIIATVAYYGITLLEAYVDAQLSDFDIGTDLSLHIRPTLLENKYGVSNSPGLQLSLRLK
jgi:hypothetical protein